MSDAGLREMARASSRGDLPIAHLIATEQRAGIFRSFQSFRDGGFKEGDLVEIREVESPWMTGDWMARILKVGEDGDAWVQAVDLGTSIPRFPFPGALAAVWRKVYMTRRDTARYAPLM